MKKDFKKFQRVPFSKKLFFFVIALIYLVSLFFFGKSLISLNGIETLVRYILLLLLCLYFLFFFHKSVNKLLKRKYKSYLILCLITFIISVILCLCAFFIDLIYDKISGFYENDQVVYTSKLIALKDQKINSDSLLGMINDEEDIEGYILAKELINKYSLENEVKQYDSYLSMLYDLYNEKVDGIFISGNYEALYSSEEDFSNIAIDTSVIYEYSKKMKNVDLKVSSNKSLDEPFTALIMGVDSEYDGLDANAAFNGDTLILVTFNPHTLNATLFSIPRDTYVPIACRKGAYAKINSSAARGSECVIDTITDLTGIDIDYYIKINFKGVVDLVEAVGGIDVDVEKPDFNINHGHDCKNVFCEQNSNRNFADGTIYITPGYQTLNGEEALAYARNRGQYLASDLARNRHQQEVILALAKKMVKINSYSQFKKVLDSISNNISTNMNTNQILSSYSVFKDIIGNMLSGEEFMGITKTYLETYSLPVYLPSSGRTTSALGYYEESLNEIIKAMNINLEKEKPTFIKSFNYDINEEYEEAVIGKGIRSGSTTSTIPNFISKTKQEAESYCDENNLKCRFHYIDQNSEYFNSEIEVDKIAYQNPYQGSLLLDVNEVNFYIIGKID